MGWLISTDEQHLEAESRSSLKVAKRVQNSGLKLEMIKEENKQNLGPLEKYHISPKVLGAGGFGKVFLAWSVDDVNIKFAVKALKKKNSKVRLSDVK